MRDKDGLQLDFMTAIHGVKSFEALRAQSTPANLGDVSLMVASMAAIIASNGAGMYSMKPKKRVTRKQQLEALKAESDLALTETIRRLLAKPMHERTHFLRKRVGICASAL